MEGELSHLVLAASVGAALLVLGTLAAVGGRRTVGLVRGMGLGGILLALFVGVAIETLSLSLVESPPTTLVLLPTTVLRVQALAEDPDLRTRYNVDPRLRYLPTGNEQVVDLERPYAYGAGLRWVKVLPVVHVSPSKTPKGIVTMGDDAFGKEVDGLYERAWSTVVEAGRAPSFASSRARLGFASAASVGLLAMGLIGLIGGLVPLLSCWIALLADAGRLVRATKHPSYRGVRGRAIRQGAAGLAEWHRDRWRPFASLATFGALTLLGGVLMGLLREEETRRLAHGVFAEARHLRIEGKRP